MLVMITWHCNPCFYKLLFAFSNQMEMLQAKQQEEKKILREQMEAEAKAQRDQMDNMIKASMKQAQEDKRALMKENQALKQRLLEMQKSHEGMQKTKADLTRQLQQNRSRQREVRKLGFFKKVLLEVAGALCKL